MLFDDGKILNFKKCCMNWGNNKGISMTNCVADRNIAYDIPYFLFYEDEEIKVVFNFRGIFGKRKNQKCFEKLQFLILKYGYKTYDCS